MRPQIIGHLFEHLLAQHALPCRRDEALEDGSELLVKNRILAFHLRKSLKTDFRGQLGLATADVKGENIEEVEQGVLMVSLL